MTKTEVIFCYNLYSKKEYITIFRAWKETCVELMAK